MKRYYHTLDAMRGAAAVGVVMLHLHALTGPLTVQRGYLAVDFFFALSGLVISQAYQQRLALGLGPLQFLKLRVERLFPLYLLGSALGLAVACVPVVLHRSLPFPPANMAIAAITALFMLPAPVLLAQKPWLMPLNVAAWSLFFELLVNIAFALGLYRATRLTLVAIAVASAALLAGIAWNTGNLDLGATWPTAYAGLIRTAFSFTVGILVGRRVNKQAARVSQMALVLPVVLLLTLCVPITGPLAGPAYDLVCIVGLYPLLLYAGARWEPRRPGIGALLGAISYPLYTLHGPILALLVGALIKHGPQEEAPRFALALGIVMALMVIAGLADRWFDRPVRAWLAQLRTRSTTLPA